MLHAPEKIRCMTRSRNDFKTTQVFDWEAEPKDERPSEFVPSTGFSSLSGYYSMPPDARVMRHNRRSSGGGGVRKLPSSWAWRRSASSAR